MNKFTKITYLSAALLLSAGINASSATNTDITVNTPNPITSAFDTIANKINSLETRIEQLEGKSSSGAVLPSAGEHGAAGAVVEESISHQPAHQVPLNPNEVIAKYSLQNGYLEEADRLALAKLEGLPVLNEVFFIFGKDNRLYCRKKGSASAEPIGALHSNDGKTIVFTSLNSNKTYTIEIDENSADNAPLASPDPVLKKWVSFEDVDLGGQQVIKKEFLLISH